MARTKDLREWMRQWVLGRTKVLVGYCRVSTSNQGRSGLGLQVQREAIERFVAAEGCTLVRIFVEVETGKSADARGRRPQLVAPPAQAAAQ